MRPSAAFRAARAAALGLAAFAGGMGTAASADEFRTAVFSGLDKITARVSQFEAAVNEPARFGALQILVRACNKKPPEELPQTAAYVEIRQINEETDEVDPQPIFRGWMFAESPGLNALEHPVYDVWLKTCKTASGPASSGNR